MTVAVSNLGYDTKLFLAVVVLITSSQALECRSFNFCADDGKDVSKLRFMRRGQLKNRNAHTSCREKADSSISRVWTSSALLQGSMQANRNVTPRYSHDNAPKVYQPMLPSRSP